MRSAIEIAKDITETRQWLDCLRAANIYGKTQAELAEIEARRMGNERKLYALESERMQWITAASQTGE